MSETAIRVEGLGKRYVLGERVERYRTLRDALARAAGAPLRRMRRLGRRAPVGADRELWALKGVSFEVGRGEVVGIVGHNGAGKSTLLKVLSRITEPTEGRASVWGRMGALLEVGTGFHPELTGRENVFLNGAILGMGRAEVAAKFDEIVDFAGVERFVDTPVKHYSSGMHLRLAFAVAAHLEPEIIVVDEVLAVGDAAFQAKCLGKMQDTAREGRTVLFVSHNMGAVASLCTRGIVMDGGRPVFDGSSTDAIATYLRQVRARGGTPLAKRTDRTGNGKVRLLSLGFLDDAGEPVEAVSAGQAVTVDLAFEAPGEPRSPAFQLTFTDSMGHTLFTCLTRVKGSDFAALPARGRVRCRIPHLPLAPGLYGISAWCKVDGFSLADRVDGAAELTVTEGDFFGTGKMLSRGTGSFLVDHDWALAEAP